jgi:hypothetical protein
MGIALWKKALAVVGMLAAAGNAMADTAGAAAAYKRGQQYQTAKQWGGAVKEYQAALKEDPKYFYAYKALGKRAAPCIFAAVVTGRRINSRHIGLTFDGIAFAT